MKNITETRCISGKPLIAAAYEETRRARLGGHGNCGNATARRQVPGDAASELMVLICSLIIAPLPTTSNRGPQRLPLIAMNAKDCYGGSRTKDFDAQVGV